MESGNTENGKISPFSLMGYNNMLMMEIMSVTKNIDLGGTGFEQAQNLWYCLKPTYQRELAPKFHATDGAYNKAIIKLETLMETAPLASDRIKYYNKLRRIRRDYARQMVAHVVAILEKYQRLENIERSGIDSSVVH